MLIRIKPGLNLINLFGVNLLTIFLKLYHFIPMQQIVFTFIKWPNLQKAREELCQNSFIKSTTGLPAYQTNF
jgi:hypothetical protein